MERGERGDGWEWVKEGESEWEGLWKRRVTDGDRPADRSYWLVFVWISGCLVVILSPVFQKRCFLFLFSSERNFSSLVSFYVLWLCQLSLWFMFCFIEHALFFTFMAYYSFTWCFLFKSNTEIYPIIISSSMDLHILFLLCFTVKFANLWPMERSISQNLECEIGNMADFKVWLPFPWLGRVAGWRLYCQHINFKYKEEWL